MQRLASALPKTTSTQTPSSFPANAGGQQPALKFKPKAAVRRSKEERDAIEKAEAERNAARNGAPDSPAMARARRGRDGRGGAHSGAAKPHNNRLRQAVYQKTEGRLASGPFGGPTEKPVGGRATASKNQATREEQAESSRGRESIPQSKPDLKSEKPVTQRADKSRKAGKKGTPAGKRKKPAQVKEEDDGQEYVSSDGGFNSDPGAKVNIERINLISEDDSSAADSQHIASQRKGKERESPSKSRHHWMNRPITIERQSHVERNAAVSTNASSLTSAELRRRAKARQGTNESLFLSDDDDVAILHASKSTIRRKPRDVEFLKDERKWKGVWTVDETSTDVPVKAEPLDDENSMVVDVDPPQERTMNENMDMDVDEEDSREQAAITTAQTGKSAARSPIQFEYYEIQDDYAMSSLCSRLFAYEEDDDFADVQDLPSSPTLDPTLLELKSLREQYLAAERSASAKSSKSKKQTPAATEYEQTHARSADRSYLVQLPPIMPLLHALNDSDSLVKDEEQEEHTAISGGASTSGASGGTSTNYKHSHLPDDGNPTGKATDHLTYTQSKGHLPHGHAGTLRFYSSGKGIAMWGGMSFDIAQESRISGQAREVFITDREVSYTKAEGREEGPGEVVKLGGSSRTGVSVGQVGTNLIGVPDLGSLLG